MPTDRINQDNPIAAQVYKLAGSMSYYNAAEGANWYQESQARGQCQLKLKEALKAASLAGIELDLSGYLL